MSEKEIKEENASYDSPQLEMIYSDGLFQVTSNAKPKDFQFTIIPVSESSNLLMCIWRQHLLACGPH